MSVFKQVNCPSCGASQDIKNPAISQATCEFCSTVFIFDKDAVRDTGKKSRLMPAISGLKVGTDGKLKGKSFTVIGRVQYKYTAPGSDVKEEELGKWDGWYLQFSDGSPAWISEDMGELLYEAPIKERLPVKESEILPGDKIKIAGKQYQIREKGTILCVGAEGQLPFPVIPEETHGYVDGISLDDNSVLTLEFDEEEGPTGFTGRVLKKEEISYQKEVQAEEKRNNEALRCPSCASPLETHNMDVQNFTITCSACGTMSQFNASVATVLGKVKPALSEVFMIPLAANGKLFGKDWMVVGRQRKDWKDDGETGFEVEYLLFNADSGYLWLSEEDGHYYTAEPAEEKPHTSLISSPHAPKAKIKIGKDYYQFYETGEHRLTYVDGVLPWFAKIGDVTKYGDAIAPPHMLSEEFVIHNNEISEIEYYKSTYINSQDIAKAFNLSIPKPSGVSPGQPYNALKGQRLISLSSIAVGIFLMINACGLSDKKIEILKGTYNALDLKKKEVYTKPFTIEKADETLRIDVRMNLNNSWASVGIALFDNKKEVILSDEDVGIEYYSGYEGGESWSEGSQNSELYWKVKEPGEYRLMLAVPETDLNSSAKLDVTINKGVYKTGSLYFFAFLWFLQPLVFRIRKWLFETSRWSDVLGDD